MAVNASCSTITAMRSIRRAVNAGVWKQEGIQCTAEDIVVTQDVGLAAMVLPKAKAVLNTYGWFYTDRNIDRLLNRRHISSVQRRNFHKRPKKQAADNAQNLGRQLTKAVSA